jgi:hypothetical protein
VVADPLLQPVAPTRTTTDRSLRTDMSARIDGSLRTWWGPVSPDSRRGAHPKHAVDAVMTAGRRGRAPIPLGEHRPTSHFEPMVLVNGQRRSPATLGASCTYCTLDIP